MNRQFLLFQSLCAILIASSAYGGQLPNSITSKYAYCCEMTELVVESSTLTLPDSVDNLCMDLQEAEYHFLSSAQGGTKSYFRAPKVGMNVVFFVSLKMGIKLNSPSHPAATFICQFAESAPVLRVYNDLYKHPSLTREDFSIGRIEKLISNPDGSQFRRSVLSQQAGLYGVIHKKKHTVFVIKEESANGEAGNPVLVYTPNAINISGILANNNVVARFDGYPALTILLTFRNRYEAVRFRDLTHRYENTNMTVPISRSLLKIVEETRA